MFGKKGIVEYDYNGLPRCHICGKYFKRVTPHARQVHNMSAREYKIEFGLDLKKGICSKESRELSQLRVKQNPHVIDSLLKIGEKTRFKKRV